MRVIQQKQQTQKNENCKTKKGLRKEEKVNCQLIFLNKMKKEFSKKNERQKIMVTSTGNFTMTRRKGIQIRGELAKKMFETILKLDKLCKTIFECCDLTGSSLHDQTLKVSNESNL